jgi:hypothetical protein
MPRTHPALPFALLLCTALWPTLAHAISETYEGLLVPMNREAPVPIVVQLEESGGFLSGKVKIDAPLNSDSTIDSGRNVAGSCNMSSALSSSVTLRLSGSCSSTVIEGNYTIQYAKSRAVARGHFRLTRKVPAADKGKGLDSTGAPTTSVAACLKANTRCLTACPRGDTNAEYLCANHCRTKLQTCKGKVSKESDAAQ